MTNSLILLITSLVLLLPCWQRLAGESIRYVSRAPEILSTLACTLPMLALGLPVPIWALSTCSLYLALETGHGIALPMGKQENSLKDATRTQFLSPVVNLLNKLTKYPFRSKEWCSLFFGVKGFWIGLSLFPAGLILCYLWPKCYLYGDRYRYMNPPGLQPVIPLKFTALAEYLTGYALMLVVLLNMLIATIVSLIGIFYA